MFPSGVEPLQQKASRFLCEGGYIRAAHFTSGFLHPFGNHCGRGGLNWPGNRVYFWRRAVAEFTVASSAAQAIQVRAI